MLTAAKELTMDMVSLALQLGNDASPGQGSKIQSVTLCPVVRQAHIQLQFYDVSDFSPFLTQQCTL